ncbi:MAG: hypothetical protein A3H98_09445 [Bacteroidetes bacterium RIFCSPLOWO2_02_FULL_36_8]|nr:MAG: hypothetical protein A3H98_09445 [Bacteroidetes bacterium RIFCSPLOWO2_02_FULL_36_8]OFY71922.1 MAG: hypothetical protein A3G23_05215 [Bacteroidetes bacterium RIFCSPLOWO2_12_FULL_37_12]
MVKIQYLIISFITVIIISGTGTCTYAQKNETVFNFQMDSTQRKLTTVIIKKINISGLDITKPRIVLVELDINENDTLAFNKLAGKIELNRQRIYNLSIFNFVSAYIDTTSMKFEGNDLLQVTINFVVQERWYIWPIPILEFSERNFNVWWERKSIERLNYGLVLVVDNFRGRKEFLRIKVQHGYDRKYEIRYEIPNLNRKQNLGFAFEVSQIQSHSLEYLTKNNDKLSYKNDNEFPIRKFRAGPTLFYRPSLHQKTYIKLTYRFNQLSDSVFNLNKEFYSGFKEIRFFMAEFDYTFSRRNDNAFPLKGFFAEFYSIHFIPLSNSGFRFNQIYAIMSNYFPLGNNFYYSTGFKIMYLINKETSYAENTALGYSSYVRGYQLYVVDGQHFFLFKQTLSKALVKDKIIKAGSIESKKFNTIPFSLYASIFYDTGRTWENIYSFVPTYDSNTLVNRWMSGWGYGLTAVSYYDLVMRFEYSFNHLGESGFFFHAVKAF